MLEQLREAKPRRKLASAVEPARQPTTVERIRERMREAEQRGRSRGNGKNFRDLSNFICFDL